MTFNLDCCNYNEVQDPRKVNSIAACALNDLARVSGASEVKWKNCGALLFAPLAVMNTDRVKRLCADIYFHFKEGKKADGNTRLYCGDTYKSLQKHAR